ncbi:MAG: rhamnogalacturonan acetylesterase [Labilibaculum sp.]|nr:rhamnogalacturonan acetylesterase [Labilibaculum sp.]
MNFRNVNRKVFNYFIAVVLIMVFQACTEKDSQFKILDPLSKADNGFITFKNVPDGNYRVHVRVGSDKNTGHTVIRGESRRLFFDGISTKKGEIKDVYFYINKRDTIITEGRNVKIKKREVNKLNWDSNLTFEFNGESPQVVFIEITPSDSAITIFLCGDSTVVDQENEPWCSWGQIITCFFNDKVCFANYAESGETTSGFIARRRLEKLITQVKSGDYIFVEFGHNDQKEKGEGKGAYLNFTDRLKDFVTKAREKGAVPVFVTPTQRRSFNQEGKIMDTHGDYPDAMRKLAAEEDVPLIDLHSYTRSFYEALGVENSVNAFVHYPANTFPNQKKALKDNTHFNPFGANQIAKCVVFGMKQIDLPLVQYLRDEVKDFTPSQPDDFKNFKWYPTPFSEIQKPDGN